MAKPPNKKIPAKKKALSSQRPKPRAAGDPHKVARKKTSQSKKNDPRFVLPVATNKRKIFRTKKQKSHREVEKKQTAYMSMGEHFDALRWHLMRSLFYVVLLAIISSFFYQEIWELVMRPMASIIEIAKSKGIVVKTMTTKISDGFLIKLKVVIMFGVMMAVPAIIMEMWSFIVPAMSRSLKRWGSLIIIAAVILFWGGVAFSRFGVWPMVNEFLIFEWQLPEVKTATMVIQPNLYLTVNEYLGFFFSFHFAFGATFQLPIISVILGLLGVLRWGLFIKSWRGALVVIAILSAAITPPDVFSMIAIMLPLTFLYLVSGFLVWLIQRKKGY